ncbi:MAG: 30S ribosomal protein S20 [Planctomycetes bacterium]|jgi:small subunit ribosomal protein S20|nr:30S ribosomal protein S20 [Planctomycetota bacterium]
MAHSKQALKRHRQSEKKRVVNKNARTRMKSAIKRVLAAAEADQKQAQIDAMRRIDKSAKVHAIHKNAAARYKSRVAKALNKAKAVAGK